MLIAEKRDNLANTCFSHMKHKYEKFKKSKFNEAV